MKTRYRVNWRGQLILQVQRTVWDTLTMMDTKVWRDAKVQDLTEKERDDAN